jgi:hypothetical protein
VRERAINRRTSGRRRRRKLASNPSDGCEAALISPDFSATWESVPLFFQENRRSAPSNVGLARSDLREDREGARLDLSLQVVDADGCTPIRDAVGR